ncbi:organic solvent tolerance protein [Sphingomonas sp. Leaf412]|uniref:LPS-assembly protein LptD n=1 Tax=Sphingomonas sp. Leaf412 TaxID=1736370 RepID=UPI0006F7C617|nr:LPS assembly protein LptD [Sphingomonas sp. Leaf412]KQT32445.1 organic solvent tolerance protein [Sphingomonas sp. Leaf412]
MLRLYLLAGAALLTTASHAGAQDLTDRGPPPPAPEGAVAADPDQVQFSAGTLEYAYEQDVVTATGDVRMSRRGDRLRADTVTWNRKTGRVLATGNVAVTNPQGDVAYGDSIDLTDSLRDGVVDNMLVVLERGGRLAAVKGTREEDGTVRLDRAAYTPCAVADADGCPKEPTWKITSVRVTYRPDRERVYFERPRVHLFGLASPALPSFSLPTTASNDTGLLTPSIGLSRVNGVELVLPINIALSPDKSLVVAPHIFSGELPMLEARYAQRTELGAFAVRGYATSSRRSEDLSTGFASATEHAFRGYIDGVGRFQLDPNWSMSGSLRLVSDRTFLRRYDISREDRLRTNLSIERIDRDSYLSIAGWAVQTMRVGERQGLQPVALPEIDYRRRVADTVLGGTLNLQLNTLAIGRKEGQDTQRAFASGRWDLRGVTSGGQEVILTAFARADVYNAENTGATNIVSYRGTEGFSTRAIGAVAADVKWPLIGEAFGGVQRFTPRVQVVASPRIANLRVPNEDSRAVDLEDTNLFSLNRFPGYDRWEDSSRVTYGADWALDLPGVAITSNIGQSYRLDSRPSILPNGTGLSDSFSDIVGRTTVRVADFVSFIHRYRLDKDDLAIRRNEVDATVGSRATYGTIGYLRLNRDITSLEDLQDREEVRLGGRAAFARYWSVWGSAIIDLTDKSEDVLSTSDGFTPLRHRLGIAYGDDCIDLGLTWRRDYRSTGDARRGNAYLFTLSLKNIGR